MDWTEKHLSSPDASFDGGDLDCGNGLLLLIRKHLDPLDPGQLLEIRSTEISVEEDLPAWCRLTKNELVSRVKQGAQRSYLIRKGGAAPHGVPPVGVGADSHEVPLVGVGADSHGVPPVGLASSSQRPTPNAPPPTPNSLSVFGIGSWPRPRWMLQAVHDSMEGKMDAETFHQTADDAVRLAVSAQERAGVDLVTDGEQRRDNYASFVGRRLENCQMVPITDLLAYVDDPEKFAEELRSLDVPADLVRHPAVMGPLKRSRPLTVHELQFVQTITEKPVKVALPGPYLLTRTMWLECVSERVYEEREQLARDIIRILREEIQELLEAGAALVQLDEPVLTEVVFGRPQKNRSFMCGALGERKSPEEELTFAGQLLNEVLTGFPPSRLALHICRGNWSRDEGVALQGDYTPLVPLLQKVPVGAFCLEMCTPRAGEMEVLTTLPSHVRVGIGVVNPKSVQVESVEEILSRAEKAIALFGPERVLLHPDCGFATFADNPIASAQLAEAKLKAVVEAAQILREKYGQ